MSRGNVRLAALVVLFPLIASTRASGQDGGVADITSTTPKPTGRDAELQDLRERLEALEKERAAEKKITLTPGLAERVDALEQKQKAADLAANDPDYGPEVQPWEGDQAWAPGGYAPSKSVLKYGPFTGEVRADAVYHWEQSHPKDDTISGSSEVFRSGEIQLTQLGVGGDFYYKGAMVRLMTQFGLYSETTPRNDSSPSRGQWNLDNAYRYLSEAYGGYHFNVLAGINVQAGIFMSYVGLWSYYNFDNWTYQPSYVSSNTPWFFNGVRCQIFPWKNLKIEPWIVNGWQSYGKFNNGFGLGLQVKWFPQDWLCVLGNQYYGTDTLDTPGRRRIHTDDSVMVRLYNEPTDNFLSRVAASLTVDYGNEAGGGVTHESQYFMGFMAYNRLNFYHNIFGLTYGGGAIKNPGRYLVLLPPINGATAASGTPYFTENPGDKYTAWDMQVTGDWMPTEWVTFRLEYTHRFANVPYFSGKGGVTPQGGNQGAPGSLVAGFEPDLVKTENRVSVALMVRY
jgi:hypothetical protein